MAGRVGAGRWWFGVKFVVSTMPLVDASSLLATLGRFRNVADESGGLGTVHCWVANPVNGL